MLKIIKFLKPFTAAVLIAIVLLYLQAMADLALPDYMSNIVNNGIQKNGVDRAIPEIFIEDDFNQILRIVDENDSEIIRSHYQLIAADQSEDKASYANYLSKYPLIANQNIYRVDHLNTSDSEALELILSNALIQVAVLSGQLPDMNLSTLDQQTVIQMGSQAVAQYLVRLGADLESIQRAYILKTGARMLLISLIGAIASICPLQILCFRTRHHHSATSKYWL